MDEQSYLTNWVLRTKEAAERAVDDPGGAFARAARSLNGALRRGERAEILAAFDSAVRLSVSNKCWHDGLIAARRVFDVITQWDDFDVAPYALTVARFAHNYAIELEQARLYEAAEEFYNEALNLFEAHGDAFGEMVTLHQLGRARQARGDYDGAAQAYRASLNIARERRDLHRVGSNLFQMGHIAQLKHEIDESENLYCQVLALDDDIPSAPLMVGAAHQLGLIAQTRGEYDEAKQWFEQALERAERAGYAMGKADALHQLGMITQTEGNIAQAEVLYRQSLAITAHLKNSAESAPTLYQLAQCAFARKDFEAAADLCRQSLGLLQVQGDAEGIGRVKRLLNSILNDSTS